MKKLTCILIFTLLSALTLSQQTNDDKFFIVQISPVIDGKAAKPTNFTITKNQKSSLSHTLSISSLNFLKNVTIGLQLFAWYNGNWISKKPRILQITDRRKIMSVVDKRLLNFLKYADLKKLNAKQPVILNQTTIYVSYDAEGSLMTSQLQEPSFFIPASGYLVVKELNKSIQRINTTLNFKVVHKNDNFIENKRALTDLAQIKSRAEELFPLISHQINKEVIQPSQIMQLAKKNIAALAGNEKKVNEKLILISRYGFKELLVKNIKKLDISNNYLPIDDYLSKYKLAFKDSLGPIWQWAFTQPFILNDIQTLQQAFLKYPESLTNKNILKQLSQSAKLSQKIELIVFAIWIFTDFISYCFYSKNLGLSSSYGTFLNIWLIIQILSASVKTGFASVWYLGFIVLFVGLFIHFLITYFMEKRIEKFQHQKTNSDVLLISFMKNLLIFALVINFFLHLFQGTNINGVNIWNEGFQVLNKLQASPLLALFWSYSQFVELLSQYYYLLVLIPQIILNFRLKNVEKGTLLRIILIFSLCYGQSGLKQLDRDNIYLAFRFKQGILALFLLIQCLIYRKSAAISLISPIHSEEQRKRSQLQQPEENNQEKSKASAYKADKQ